MFLLEAFAEGAVLTWQPLLMLGVPFTYSVRCMFLDNRP